MCAATVTRTLPICTTGTLDCKPFAKPAPETTSSTEYFTGAPEFVGALIMHSMGYQSYPRTASIGDVLLINTKTRTGFALYPARFIGGDSHNNLVTVTWLCDRDDLIRYGQDANKITPGSILKDIGWIASVPLTSVHIITDQEFARVAIDPVMGEWIAPRREMKRARFQRTSLLVRSHVPLTTVN